MSESTEFELRRERAGEPEGELLTVVIEEFCHHPDLLEAGGLVGRAEEALAEGGYARRQPKLGGRVMAEAAAGLFQAWQTDGRPLVVYWTGHGVQGRNGELLLACTDTPGDPGDETRAVVRASELGALLAGKQVSQIVLLLDACHSGGGSGEVTEAFMAKLNALATERRTRMSLAVISSAWANQKAKEGVFAEALIRLFKGVKLPPELLPSLHRDERLNTAKLAAALQTILEDDHVDWQTIEHKLVGVAEPVFRNPHFRPTMPATSVELRADGEPPQARIAPHFLLKFRGIEVLGDRGWYFSGRDRTLREIDRWLADPRPGVFALTGPPGCGKSAVLGRLAVLSDPRTRREAEAAGALDRETPDPGVQPVGLDAGLHVRDKSRDDCVEQIAEALDLHATDKEQLYKAVLARRKLTGRPVVLLLDAIDEAKRGDVLEIADFIRDLTTLGGAKVLVGTRSRSPGEHRASGSLGDDLLDALVGDLSQPGTRVWRLNSDEDPADSEKDITRYIKRRLLDGARSPYAGKEAAADEAAAFLAARCQGMFLPARVFSQVLAHQDVPAELTDKDIQALSADDLERAFKLDLERFRAQEERVRSMLMPLAWAEGNGLPPDLWLRLARRPRPAVPGRGGPPIVLPDDSVERILEDAGAYLIEDGESGQLVYRLYAEQFGEFLRRGRDPVEEQTRIADSLIATVATDADGERDWSTANPYLLSHLPAHSAAAGALRQLFEDPGFLVHADPDPLRAVLGKVDVRVSPLARLYSRVAHRMRGLAPAERALLLQEGASRDEQGLLGVLNERLDTVWHGLGSTSEPVPFHRVLRGHNEPVTLLGFCRGEDRLLLASAGRTAVNLWDPADGERWRTLTRPRVDPRRSAFGSLPSGVPVLATAEPGTISFTGLLNGRPARAPLPTAGAQPAVIAFGVMSARPVIAVGGPTGVSVFDLDAPDGTETPWRRVETGPVLDLALASSADRDVLAVVNRDGITLWDPGSGRPLHRSVVGDSLWAMAVAFDGVGGLMLAWGEKDGAIRVWRENAAPLSLAGHERTVRSLTFVPGFGGGALLSGSEDGTCRLWYLADGSHRVLQERANNVLALAATADAGKTIVATGSGNRDVRVWDPAPPRPDPADPARAPIAAAVRVVALGGAPGGIRAVLGTEQGSIQARTLDGRLARHWDAGHGRVASLACRGALGAAGFPGGALAFLDLGSAGLSRLVEHAHTGSVEALAFNAAGDLLVSGGAEGLIRFWRDGRDTTRSIRADAGAVRSLSLLAAADGELLACATRRSLCVYPPNAAQPSFRTEITARDPALSTCLLATLDEATVLLWSDVSGVVRLSEPRPAAPVLEFAGHTEPVRCLGLGRIGSLDVLATAGEDRTVRLWDPHTTECLDVWTAHTQALDAAAFRFDDGRLIRALGMERAVHIAEARRAPSARP